MRRLQGLDRVPLPHPGPWEWVLESPPGSLAAEGSDVECGVR